MYRHSKHIPSLIPMMMLALCLCALSAVAAAQDASSAPSSLAAELQTLVDQSRLPGAYAVLERDGAVLDSALVGWQDEENSTPLRENSIFRLFSMSKPITSVAVMMLVEQGRLALDDDVAKYLPALKNMRVYVSGDLDDMVTEAAQRPITIRDLLLHNSGIAYHFTGDTPVHRYYRKYGVMRDTPVGRKPGDGAPARSLGELVQRIGDAPLLHQPGAGFHYSYSTTVLGAVIERVMAADLANALHLLLFEPLGMTDTGFFISEGELPRFTTLYRAVTDGLAPEETPEKSDYRDAARLLDGGGAMASTAGDYLRFVRMLANGGALNGRRFLSEAAVRELFRAHLSLGGTSPDKTGFGYGFLVGNESSEQRGSQPAGSVSWSGSGNTFFFLQPDTGLIALFMTHVLTPGDHAARSAQFRRLMTERTVRARQSGE